MRFHWVNCSPSSPIRTTRPAVGLRMPRMMRIRVVLPDPLGPIRARKSPGAMENDTSWSTSRPWKLKETFSTKMRGLPGFTFQPPLQIYKVRFHQAQKGSLVFNLLLRQIRPIVEGQDADSRLFGKYLGQLGIDESFTINETDSMALGGLDYCGQFFWRRLGVGIHPVKGDLL